MAQCSRMLFHRRHRSFPAAVNISQVLLWSVWLGLFFLLDPINGWAGRPSLLRDWQKGDLGRTAVLLLAGYICGFFWEFWNYWAYTKWIYTIPIPDMPRIFEMP